MAPRLVSAVNAWAPRQRAKLPGKFPFDSLNPPGTLNARCVEGCGNPLDTKHLA